MPTPITLRVADLTLRGELDDAPTASRLAARFPLSVAMNRWGDEYYGDLGEPLDGEPGAATREVMEIGELAYWQPGNALCIFFGPTPASRAAEPRAASPVIPVGRLAGAEALRRLGGSITVRVETRVETA